jgi:heterodisulfide reductase subunit C
MSASETMQPLNCESLVERFGVNFNRCFHCQCCGSGCPFIRAMDFAPNAVIRLMQLGYLEEALASRTIWVCVACNTCSMQCPMAIDIPAVMDGLRQLALDQKVVVAEPDILTFHQSVLENIKSCGRTHKLDIMLRYKYKTRSWVQDWQVGLKMLAKRKLDLLPSRVKSPASIRRLFDCADKDEPHD